MKRHRLALAVVATLTLPHTAHAVRIYEEGPETAPAVPPPPPPPPPPPAASDGSNASPAPGTESAPGATSPAEPARGVVSTVVYETTQGPHANPDLRPADEPVVTPIAASSPIGASRYAAGQAVRFLDVGMYLQPQFEAQTGYNSDPTSTTPSVSVAPGFIMRRTRLILHAQVHPLLQIRMEFNLSDRLQTLDAYGLIAIHRGFNIQLGQFRVPFSRRELISGARYQLPTNSLWEGSTNVSGVTFIPSYDAGVMVWGWLFDHDLLEYYAGVFNGEGSNQLSNLDGNFLYAGRVVFNPLGRPRSFQEGAVGLRSAPLVQIGVNANYQRRTIGTLMMGTTTLANNMDVTTAGADVFFSGWGASLYGEFYYRDTHTSDAVNAPSTESLGFLAQVGYLLPWGPLREHLEIVARVQDFAPSACVFRGERAVGATPTTDDCVVRLPASVTSDQYQNFMHTTAYTFGVNWYQLGHGAKLSASYTVNNENSPLSGQGPGSGIVNNDLFLLQLSGSI